jgi:hypothetical protein
LTIDEQPSHYLAALHGADPLRDARRRASAEKVEWLDEAIEQITDRQYSIAHRTSPPAVAG